MRKFRLGKKAKYFLLFVLVFFIGLGSSYYLTNPGGSNFGRSGGSFFSTDYTGTADFDRSACLEGQDFILNVDPISCSPSVVRSDLLEEQDVPVFCEIDALKINPIIDVNAIRDIDFKGDRSSGIKSIKFHNLYSALGPNQKLNNLQKDSIGNVVIVLRQNSNESSMPDYVEANLTAFLKYDLNSAFGVRYPHFYLPVMSDSEFDQNSGKYPFFDKRGFLRAEAINKNSARIAVYADYYESSFGKSREGNIEKQRLGFYDLDVGESTPTLYLPGYDCYAGAKIKLLGLENPDTTVRFLVGSEEIELREKEQFLDKKCTVGSIDDLGATKSVEVICDSDDNSRERFNLFLSQKVRLEINGIEGEYSLGDYLFSFEAENGKGTEHAYLGVVNSRPASDGSLKDLQVHIVSTTKKKNKLDETEISILSRFAESHSSNRDGFFADLEGIINKLSASVKRVITGTKYVVLEVEGQEAKFGEENYEVSLKGLAEIESEVINSESKEYYDLANEDFDTTIFDYEGEEYAIEGTMQVLSKKAYWDKILLAADLGQRREAWQICEDFQDAYPNSEYPEFCLDKGSLYGDSRDRRVVFINGEAIPIVLREVSSPRLKDYSAEISIRNKKQEVISSPTLVKDQIVYIDNGYHEGDYIKLEALDEDYASIQISYIDEEDPDKDRITKTVKLNLNDPESFSSDYIFRLEEVMLNKVAHVMVDTDVDAAGSQANLSVRIGIEKRLIQLSPNKTQDRIDKLNNTIGSFNDVTEKVEMVEQGMKAACLATGGVLTLKNLIGGMGGTAIARNEVMTGEGGWNEVCKKALDERNPDGSPVYVSFEDCLFEHSDNITADVKELEKAMNEQNEEFKKIYQSEGILSQGTLQDNVVDKSKLAGEYSEKVRGSLQGLESIEGVEDGKIINPQDRTESLDLESLRGVLDKEGFNERLYSIDDAKKIELYAKLLKEDPTNEAYRQRLYNSLEKLSVVSESSRERESWADELGIPRSKISFVNTGSRENGIENTRVYEGLTYEDTNDWPSESKKNNPIQAVQTKQGKKLILELDDSVGSDRLTIKNEEYESVNENGEKITKLKYFIWDSEKGRYLDDSEIPQEVKDLSFLKKDEVSYDNKMVEKDAVVRYHETEPFKGLPAVVPFDKEEGWYAYIKSSLPTLGSRTGGYSDSGRVERFYICNVGNNGLINLPNGGVTDDCALIDLGIGQTYESFLRLDRSKSSRVLKDATTAIYQAQRNYKDGVKQISILGKAFDVGSPVYETTGYQCTDYMSPTDCQVLFNVCDPVICPSSRCDFGGKYPVQDVIQSGVVGSIALCLPNYQEGIYVPVCISGVRAGMEGFGSVLESYRDCLEKSLETGETVGVCDEIHSIYVCEFFWRQAVPLVKFGVPKLISLAKGENVRGGGEYLGVTSAWENAKSSMEYFTNFYAVNSYKAFKSRSTEQVGGQFCKVFSSISYPRGQGVLDLLLEGDSPHQFNGHFDEIPMTSQTNPPFSHYKTYFHIYAGDDRSAYYSVYLRGGSSSYYQDTLIGRTVDSGYIPRGEYESKTIDMTAPSGYTEMCIRVNDQEECGFGRAGTSFAYNYMADQYIQRQANTTDITSEKECISGTSDLYSLGNLNVQEGVDNMINPEIYNRGVVRVCSTTNPGQGVASDQAGTENSRWKDVGNCGDTQIRCWIDTQSLEKAFEWEYSYNETKESLNDHYLDQLIKSEGGMTPAQFEDYLEKILDKDLSLEDKIKMINKNISSVVYPEEKAYLHYLRGTYYADLARKNLIKPEEKVIDLNSVFGISSQPLDQGIDYLEVENGGGLESGSCVSEDLEVVKAISSGSYKGISKNGNPLILVSGAAVYENPDGEGYGMNVQIYSDEGNSKCYSGILRENENLYFIEDNSAENVLAVFELNSNNRFSSLSYSTRGPSVGEDISLVYYDFDLEKPVKKNGSVFGVNDEEFTISYPFEKEARGGLVFNSEGKVLGVVYSGGGDYSSALNSRYINSQIGNYVSSEGTPGEMPDLREEAILEYFTDANFVSPIFEVKTGIFKSNICYQFFEQGWWWTNDCNAIEKGYRTSSASGSLGGASVITSQVSWLDSEDLNSERIDRDNRDLYEELSDFNRYSDGVEFILREINNKGMKFSVGDVRVKPDGSDNVFEVGIFEEALFMFYGNVVGVSNEDKWYWSLLTDNPDKEALWVKDLSRTSQLKWRGIDRVAETMNSVWSTVTLNWVKNKDYSFLVELSSDQKKMFELIKKQTDSDVEGAMIIFSYDDFRNYLSVKIENRNLDVVSVVEQMSPLQIQAFVQELLDKGIITEEDYEFLEENDFSKGLVISLIKNLPDLGAGTFESIRDIESELEEDFALLPSQERVISQVKFLEGEPRGEIEDYDNSDTVNCFDSVMHVYSKANVDKRCVYTDGESASYDVKLSNGDIFTVDTSGVSGVTPYYCTPESSSSCENSVLPENQKLSLLEPGYVISYASEFLAYNNDPLGPHNAVFLGWVDKQNHVAKLFDWNGVDNGEKVFRTYNLDISDDSHPVYQIWKPYLGEDSDYALGVGEDDSEDVFGEVNDLKSAHNFLSGNDEIGLNDKVSDNPFFEDFINHICGRDILSKAECVEIKGEGNNWFSRTFNFEKDANYVLNLFKSKLSIVEGEESSSEEKELGEGLCNSDHECQLIVGNLILDYAGDVKEMYGFSDEEVKKDTGYNSFECMVLGQAMQESSLKFCEGFQLEGDPLYCDGDPNLILRGDSGKSYGVMQINSEKYPDGNYYTLKDNVDFGISILDRNYRLAEKAGDQGRYYTCKQKFYPGWQLALRYYNGWFPSNCESGDKDYVEKILEGNKDFVEKNFEECKS